MATDALKFHTNLMGHLDPQETMMRGINAPRNLKIFPPFARCDPLEFVQ